ncbi:hypothetical protein BLNAU_22751 [Blattamonas nauphoetae]|uniref:2Fe-2S ferredoxin-type domain-containing protein n=1 Tax=Blattamonas nauphoetae TaxID=2049346 RepID=A0ABQ9WV71_9EUKA|nr:hypothetical protein BLNAU_22751 [Blattamonas nauphoetae]
MLAQSVDDDSWKAKFEKQFLNDPSLASVLFHSSVSASKYKSFPAKQFFAGSSVIEDAAQPRNRRCPASTARKQNCPYIPCRVRIQQKARRTETAQHSVTIKSPTATAESIRVPILKPTFDCIHPSGRCMKCVVAIESEDADFEKPAAVAEHSINEQARTVNDPTSFHQSAPPCSDVVAEVHQQLMKVWEAEREVWVMDGLVVRGCVDGVRETRRDRRVSNEK